MAITKHTMIIRPGLPIKERHDIEEYLEAKGYDIKGGGQYIDLSQSDITFEFNDEK